MKKNDLIITKARVILFTLLLSMVPISYFFNKSYDVSFSDICINYIVSITMLFTCLFVKGGNKYFRIILLMLSLIWFIFITLYYLIGFHNPSWGN
jgi:glucan phosphoethanolaminetransferase (alkaline phosphatase superfamily)